MELSYLHGGKTASTVLMIDDIYIYILLYIYFIYTYINRDEIFSILGFQLGSKSDFQCCCRW